MHPDDANTTPKTVFRLEVRPETPCSLWHATLRPENAIPLEFESPLELARHLANLGVESQVMNTRPRGGLR